MKKGIFLVALLFLLQSANCQEGNKVDWNTDLDYLAKELPERHYNFFTVRNQHDFLSGINSIKKQSGNLSDLQTALKVQQLIATFGDSHTALNFPQWLDKKQNLPLQLFWASDGIFILQTSRGNEQLLEGKLLSINKIPINTVIDSLSTLITVDNKASVKKLIPSFIPSLQLLKYFGIAKNLDVEIEIQTSSNDLKSFSITPSELNRQNRVTFHPDTVTFPIKNQNIFFKDMYNAEDKIYYMLYNRCWSKELELQYGNKDRAASMPSFKEFENKVFEVLKKEPVNKIIFDMRYNGGGNSLQGSNFIGKLSEFLKSNPNIKIYVVVGRNTYSSAILNAMDFKRLTNAIFVGEETWGKPNHFGEVKTLNLPTSKLRVSYSTKYFKRMDEDLSTFAPDVLIEASFTDLKKGTDPVYEWIRKQ